MRKLTMSMCANRDYLEGYNRAVDDAAKDIDALRAALEAIIANETAYNRGDALSAYIAKTALGIPA